MKKYVILLLVALGFMGCVNNTLMEIEGKLSVKGLSANTYLAIQDSKTKRNYKIQNQENFNLIDRQKQTVRVKAILIKEAVGPGFPAVIKVVEVK